MEEGVAIKGRPAPLLAHSTVDGIGRNHRRTCVGIRINMAFRLLLDVLFALTNKSRHGREYRNGILDWF